MSLPVAARTLRVRPDTVIELVRGGVIYGRRLERGRWWILATSLRRFVARQSKSRPAGSSRRAGQPRPTGNEPGQLALLCDLFGGAA
jgi:hypothetical protein